MSAPQKPWEGAMNSNSSTVPLSGFVSGPRSTSRTRILNSNASLQSAPPLGNVRTVTLPPLPRRPAQLTMGLPNRATYGMSHGGLGGYPGYGGFMNSYGGYGGYGGYSGNMYSGGYGYGGLFGQNGLNFENRFLQAAEESSRGAFQSVESVVQTFASVTMMLESTYCAMYSSFRAILGVVDNFSRLRQMLTQFFSAITILTVIRNFYRRLLYWLGVIDRAPQTDEAWAAAASSSASALTPGQRQPVSSSWPLVTFIGLLLGGPYLISKLLPSNPDAIEPTMWDPHTEGTWYQATYPHQAASPKELSFAEREVLNVAPTNRQMAENNGWWLAANSQNQTGYVPANRLVQVNVRNTLPDQN